MAKPAPKPHGKHARRAAFQAKIAKKAPAAAPSAVPPVPGAASLPQPGAPSAMLNRSIKFPGQPVGGGSLAGLLMG